MNVDIYIRERNSHREIRIPWLPEKINFSSGGTIRAEYDIMNKGPVEIPTGSGLCKYTWESQFPGEYRNDDAMLRGQWKHPSTYHNMLEDWKAKGTPLTIIVTGYPINKDVILADYNGSAAGAFGDIEYELEFIEDRDITIKASKLESSAATKRPAESKKTYTIKSGDTLWAIAKKELGAGNKWETIYNANKEIIEATAKSRKKRDSEHGHWIYPGTVLTIPK